MLIDEYHKNLPDYYDTMYLDGYTPEHEKEIPCKPGSQTGGSCRREGGTSPDRKAVGKGSQQSP